MQRIVDLDELIGQVAAAKPAVALAASVSRVEAVDSSSLHLRVDRVNSAQCVFARILAGTTEFEFRVRGTYRVERCRAGGWLARPLRTTRSAYWLPCVPRMRSVDGQQHVLTDTERSPEAVSIDQGGVSITVASPDQHLIDLVVWQMPDDVALELSELEPIETQPFFLWGSHTAYARPSDVYQHLIFGHVYENRFSWPNYRKICAENDAHALYVVLGGLAAATGKQIYRLLMQQLLLSVLSRQGADGGFRHGEWTENMEAHFRMHCAAMHLMIESLHDFPAATTREALKGAAAFLDRARTTIDGGAWFLHDELERSEESMRQSPFKWAHSRALGKSPSNMLVLNTHLDATIALDRYAAATGDREATPVIAQAVASTRRVLAQRPAEWLYRLVFWPISLTLLPKAEQAKLPLYKRAAKRVAAEYLIPNLYRLKAHLPRLVMPGGYVDRALVLASWSFHYLTVNLMDLVRHQRRLPTPEVEAAIQGALRFTRESGVLARWAELKYERYALGYWAEALFQYCVDHPEAGLESLLAEATHVLEDLGMGLPPSVLGANSEIVEPAEQVPCPLPPAAGVRILNLGRRSDRRFLLVNCTNAPVECGEWAGTAAEAALPPRGWRLFRPSVAALQSRAGRPVAV